MIHLVKKVRSFSLRRLSFKHEDLLLERDYQYCMRKSSLQLSKVISHFIPNILIKCVAFYRVHLCSSCCCLRFLISNGQLDSNLNSSRIFLCPSFALYPLQILQKYRSYRHHSHLSWILCLIILGHSGSYPPYQRPSLPQRLQHRNRNPSHTNKPPKYQIQSLFYHRYYDNQTCHPFLRNQTS